MTAAATPAPPTRATTPPRPRPPATRGALLVAWLVDVLVVTLPALVTWYLTRSVVLGALVAAEVAVVLLVLRAATGRTPGAWVTRVVHVAEGSDRTPGLRREIVHALVWFPLHLTLVGPAVTIATGRDGRDWTDRLAGTAGLDLRSPTQAPTLGHDDYGRAVLPTPGAGTWARSGDRGFPTAQVQGSPDSRQSPMPTSAPGPAPASASTSTAAPTQAPAPAPDRPAPAAAAPAGPPRPASAPPTSPALAVAPAATTAVPAPAPFDTPVTASAPGGARVWLVLDSGEREQVDSVLVLGRAPGTAAAGERAVTVADPTRSLSRTHLRIGPDGDGVWVEDAFSANGTSARTAVGEEIVLERGVRRHLDAGAVLVLGERSITVVREGVSRH